MTRDERLRILREWEQHIMGLDAHYDAIYEVLALPPDSPFIDAVFRQSDLLTEVVALAVGLPHDDLSYYRLECEMGARPLTAGILMQSDGLEVKVVARNIEDLADLAERYESGEL